MIVAHVSPPDTQLLVCLSFVFSCSSPLCSFSHTYPSVSGLVRSELFCLVVVVVVCHYMIAAAAKGRVQSKAARVDALMALAAVADIAEFGSENPSMYE